MIDVVYAMASQGEMAPQGNLLGTMMPFILLLVIFYFLLIRPQQKKQKMHQEMLQSLKKGDRVVTTGGIQGTVVGIKENIVVLRVAENVKIEFLKNFISQVV